MSVQSRNLHWPGNSARDGLQHDNYHRSLTSPSSNRDIHFVDQLIDSRMAIEDVDPDRIYVMGWSNGGYFARMYAIARFVRSTPGGHMVAAAAVYSAADPFSNLEFDEENSCRLKSYPASNVPLYMISRSCDVVACRAEHLQKFRTEGQPVAPFMDVPAWTSALSNQMGNSSWQWQIILGNGSATTSCTSTTLCSWNLASYNHLLWPNGIADSSGQDWEVNMLTFLRNNPR